MIILNVTQHEPNCTFTVKFEGGGVENGFLKSLYHISTEEFEKIEDTLLLFECDFHINMKLG